MQHTYMDTHTHTHTHGQGQGQGHIHMMYVLLSKLTKEYLSNVLSVYVPSSLLLYHSSYSPTLVPPTLF